MVCDFISTSLNDEWMIWASCRALVSLLFVNGLLYVLGPFLFSRVIISSYFQALGASDGISARLAWVADAFAGLVSISLCVSRCLSSAHLAACFHAAYCIQMFYHQSLLFWPILGYENIRLFLFWVLGGGGLDLDLFIWNLIWYTGFLNFFFFF